jgi:hypothetical protein
MVEREGAKNAKDGVRPSTEGPEDSQRAQRKTLKKKNEK